MGKNPETRAPHKFTSNGMTTSVPYIRENGISPIDLLEVVQYAHKTMGSSSAQLPLVSSNLFFNPFIIALLVALA